MISVSEVKASQPHFVLALAPLFPCLLYVLLFLFLKLSDGTKEQNGHLMRVEDGVAQRVTPGTAHGTSVQPTEVPVVLLVLV
jgi:hypothetical protein